MTAIMISVSMIEKLFPIFIVELLALVISRNDATEEQDPSIRH